MLMLRNSDVISRHLWGAHRLSQEEYSQLGGYNMDNLGETAEEERVNTIAQSLKCRRCPAVSKGFQLFLDHTNIEHMLAKAQPKLQLHDAVRSVADQLGMLVACSKCCQGALLHDALEVHLDHYHRTPVISGCSTSTSKAIKKMHSCRLCGFPMLMSPIHIHFHVRQVHNLSPEEYGRYLKPHGLLETLKEHEVNVAASSLKCPKCAHVRAGFGAFLFHLNNKHGTAERRPYQLWEALELVKDQLGLASCRLCSSGAVMKDFLPFHTDFYHRGDPARLEQMARGLRHDHDYTEKGEEDSNTTCEEEAVFVKEEEEEDWPEIVESDVLAAAHSKAALDEVKVEIEHSEYDEDCDDDGDGCFASTLDHDSSSASGCEDEEDEESPIPPADFLRRTPVMIKIKKEPLEKPVEHEEVEVGEEHPPEILPDSAPEDGGGPNAMLFEEIPLLE